jgi:hypothetical protein
MPALIAAGLIGGLIGTLAGCGEDPPPPAPVVQAPPPNPGPPPPPPVTPISELMVQLGIDDRVNLPEDKAPGTDAQRIAVLKFCDAFVRGNHASARPMLSLPDQLQLDLLVESGTWAETADQVSRVDVQTGRSPEGDNAMLAIFHTGLQFQPQLWLMEVGGDDATFDALPTPPGIMNRLSGDDWIAAWFDVNAAEIARAGEPDEAIVVPQQDFTEAAEFGGDTGGQLTPGGSPSPGSPGVPGRRRPGSPVAPPRGPGFDLPGH